jgi:hypothetical protein
MATLKKALDEVGKLYIKELTLQLLRAGKKASGELINSLSYEVLTTVDGYLLQISAEDYITFVDKGRKPGRFPPRKAIDKWIKTRNIKPKGITQDQLSFLISRKIKEKGIKPTNVLSKTKKNILLNINKILTKGFNSEIEEEIRKILKSL